METTKITKTDKYVKELKKGDVAIFYGLKYEVTEDAVNLGQKEGYIGPYVKRNNDMDVWFAPCVCLEIEKAEKDTVLGDVLRSYNGFQANSDSSPCMVTVLV